jgi:hypothetical protein
VATALGARAAGALGLTRVPGDAHAHPQAHPCKHARARTYKHHTRRRTELDYGLGKRDEGRETEHILVAAAAPCLERLAASAAAAAGGGGGGAPAGGGAGVEVAVQGWNQGVAAEQQRTLGSWRELRPAVRAAAAGPPP